MRVTPVGAARRLLFGDGAPQRERLADRPIVDEDEPFAAALRR